MINRIYIKHEFIGKCRFHYHQATIYKYLYEDGVKQIEFWSYKTPIIVKVGRMIYFNPKKYSITTSKQTTRFCREYDIQKDNAEIVNEQELRNICI